MRTHHLVASALLLVSGASPGSAEAAEWIRTSSEPSAAPADRIAERFVAGAGRAALGLETTELSRRGALTIGQGSVVRFDQRHRGLVVDGRGAALQIARDGRVRLAMVDVARALDVDVVPTLDAAGALERARGASLSPIGRMVRAELVVVPRQEGHLAWSIDALDARGGTRLLIDAHHGRLLGQRPLALDARGLVYAVSSVVSETPSEVDLATLDVTADPIRLDGWDGLLQVGNYVSGGQQNGYQVEQTLAPTAGEDFLHPVPADAEDPTDGFAQVNLFYHLTQHRTFFRDVLGVALDDASWKVTAVANLQEQGQPLDNAFFSPAGLDGNGDLDAPNLIGIGQGTIDFSYDSDVFKHEFGHYVSHNAVGYNLGQAGFTEYGLSPHSGSVDEGIADYFACSENDDPILGEASLALLSAARDLTDTSKSCPGDMVGEVHADGELVASLAWTIRESIGRAAADRLVWGAVSLMPVGGTLGDFATGLLATAEGLVEEGELEASDVATLEALIAERGLDACGAVLPLEDEAALHTTILGLDIIGQAFGVSCGQIQQAGFEMQSIFHFAGAAPGADGATFHVDVDAVGGGDLAWRLIVRKGEHVGFDSGATGLPQPDAFDYQQASDGSSLDLVIDASSDPPFDPSATYYAVIMNGSCPSVTADITLRAGGTGEGGGGPAVATASASGTTTGAGPAAGATAGSGGGGGEDAGDALDAAGDGCGCRAAGESAPAGGALAALGALGAALLMRRRRG